MRKLFPFLLVLGCSVFGQRTDTLPHYIADTTLSPSSTISSNQIPWLTTTTGPAGKDGTNGLNGAQGLRGLDGTNGVNGSDGARGLQGIPGTNGLNGINGTNGLNGTNGAQGLTGTNSLPITNAFGLIWFATNLPTATAPSLTAPNGSICSTTGGCLYVRSNAAWVKK